jgi:hypothetical protein
MSVSTIRRPRGPQPALRHLAFFEVLADLPPYSAEWRAVSATLLTLRLADEWRRSGIAALDETGRALGATRRAIAMCGDDLELQHALTGVVDAMCLLGAPDTYALSVRLRAVAGVWSQRQAPQLAGASLV